MKKVYCDYCKKRVYRYYYAIPMKYITTVICNECLQTNFRVQMNDPVAETEEVKKDE